MNREHKPESMATFAVTHLTRPGSMHSERITCKHCGKTGHDEASCYELIGYPLGWSTRGGRGGRNRGVGRGRGREMANQVQAYSYGEQAPAHVEEQQSGIATAGFTAEQVQRNLSLIETPKSSHEKLSGKSIWLLDSGTSCHMTCELSLLRDVQDMDAVLVELPNGSETLAIKKGMVHLSSNLILNNVLFVPGLNCNLISIAQLVDDNICEVTFNKRLCVIQDLTTRSRLEW